jgi:nucleoside-diphosphate-sugar epimerase
MAPEEYAQFESWQDDPTVRLWNMWAYVDVRDVAHAIEKALEYEVRGKDEFFITSDVTCMRTLHRNSSIATIPLNNVKNLQVMNPC